MNAKSPAFPATNATWESQLVLSRGYDAAPEPILANVIIMLERHCLWECVLAFDENSRKIVLREPPPWSEKSEYPRRWTDEDEIRTANWFQQQGIRVGAQIVADAAKVVARDHPFHPIRDYLNYLTWDRTPRIDKWLTDYLGAEDTLYTRKVGSRWLISGVARVFEPGCKADCCLILEGKQGNRKSTALRTLSQPWYIDELADIRTKDSEMQLLGGWVIELQELDAMQRADASSIKAFISRSLDRYRPAYGRHVIDVPRGCIFAGTTNQNSYLRDEAGARRFWPVLTGTIRIEDLERYRDELWAEARERYRNREPWWLEDESLVGLADQEQVARYQADPASSYPPPSLLTIEKTSNRNF